MQQATQLPVRDLHLPEAISFWPPALGWWLLAILLLALIGLSYWLYKRWSSKAAVKAAQKLLAAIQNDTMLDNAQKIRELSGLLRRVAISIYPPAQAAGLTGEAWLAFLDSTLPGGRFAGGTGRCLIDAPYRKTPPDDLDVSELITLCADWLNSQKLKK